jgi:hypothetical protein
MGNVNPLDLTTFSISGNSSSGLQPTVRQVRSTSALAEGGGMA